MTEQSSESNADESKLEQALAEYLAAVDAGQTVDREAFVRRYPELADDLQSFFRNRDAVLRLAAPLRMEETPTLAINLTPAVSPGAKVRYFGDYELLEEIARGGMGVVYKARQVNLKRIVALKMILTGQLATEQDVQRFHSEAEAAAKLDHPGIVPIFEVGQHDGLHYFSMAFIEGESLARKVGRGLSPPREAAELTRKIALAIAYAHIAAVIHRDLKPANILLDLDGQPRVTDFGLAKHVGDGNGPTFTGQVLGTPSYMPPEQANGDREQIGPRSDIYSLGAILYCLLTGRPPFQAATAVDTLLQVMAREPVSPRRLNPAVPRDLETIALKCLEKEPTRRYQTAQALADELQRYLDGKPILARPISAPARSWRWCRRNPALSTALLCMVVLAMAFGVQQFLAVQHDRRLLAESYLEKGQTLCEQGDVGAGIHWFARGLKTAPASAADLQRAIRANLGAWYEPGARLRSVLPSAHNVTAVAFAADGKSILTANENTQLQRWDVATGQPIGKPISDRGHQNSESFSPDGMLCAVGSNDQGVDGVDTVLWDTASMRPLRTLKVPAEELVPGSYNVNAARTAFGRDGKTLVTTNHQTVRLWDVTTGQLIGTSIKGSFPLNGLHKDWIEGLALSPDGKMVATGARDNTARLWDAANGQPLSEPLRHTSWVRGVVFSPDSKMLLTSCWDGTARFWDTATGTLMGTTITHRGFIAVAYSPDGQRIMTSCGDVMADGGEKSASLWDVATRKPIGLPLPHNDYVTAVTFSSDGESVLTSGSQDVRLWDLPTSKPAEKILIHRGPVLSVAFSPDGNLFASGSDTTDEKHWNGEVRFWNASTGTLLGDPVFIEKGLKKVVFSPDGKLLAATIDAGFKPVPGKDGVSQPAWEVQLMDTTTRQLLGAPLEHWGYVGEAAFVLDSKTVTTTDSFSSLNGNEGMIRDWDVATGKLVGQPRSKPGSPGTIVDPEFRSAQGNRLRMAKRAENVLVFIDAANNKSLGLIQSPGGVGATAVSPDGALIVTGGGRAQQLWDVASQKPIGPARERVEAIAFSPDGQSILTGGRDGTARLRLIPPVVDGSVDRISVWVQVLSGSELYPDWPAVQILSLADWQNRQQRLEQLGGSPLP